MWVNKNYVNAKYTSILLFQLGAILLNIILNNYLIPIHGALGATISTILSQLLIFFLINIFAWSEYKIIIQALSPSFIKKNASNIFKAIFVKKNPDNNETNKL